MIFQANSLAFRSLLVTISLVNCDSSPDIKKDKSKSKRLFHVQYEACLFPFHVFSERRAMFFSLFAISYPSFHFGHIWSQIWRIRKTWGKFFYLIGAPCTVLARPPVTALCSGSSNVGSLCLNIFPGSLGVFWRTSALLGSLIWVIRSLVDTSHFSYTSFRFCTQSYTQRASYWLT